MKSKPALSHRKSTSSARSVVLEHLDPAVAQRDAHIAAHQAFARAQDRSNAEMALFPPPPSPSPLRPPYLQDASTRIENAETGSGVGEKSSIPRRQSVRFVGPCTVKNRGSNVKGGRPHTPGNTTIRGAADSARCPELTDGQSLMVPTLHHLQTKQGTATSTHSSRIVGDYLKALAAADDVYTQEDDIVCAPSSSRRLRRSQSLHPAQGAERGRHSVDSCVPGSGPRREVRTSMSMRTLIPGHAKENIRPQKIPILKAPKSMSFLKGRRGRISSITSHDSISTTQLNTHNSRVPSLRTKTSVFFGSKSRCGESGLRQTLRSTSSHAQLVSPSAPIGLPLSKDARGSLRYKARKASHTLKNKFLNLFASTKGDEELAFPDQHVKSQKNHTDKGAGSQDTGIDDHDQQGGGNGTSLRYNHCNLSEVFAASQGSRACSRKASLPAFGDQVWAQGGNEETVTEDKSRVTSWTNSGPSTLTSEQQLAWREWEKQRLSIIKETGTHCPSPSLRRQAIGKHILQSQESLTGQPILPGPTVDSQRIYAALMERLAETTQVAQVAEQQRKSIGEAAPPPLQITSRTDFEDYEDNGAKPAPLMVRRTTSKESLIVRGSDSGYPGKLSVSKTGDVFGLSPPITLTPLVGNYDIAKVPGMVSAERTSAFFGSPETHLFRTISPYRRALRKSMEEAEDDMYGRKSGERIISECGTEIRRPEAASDEDAYSESVYSSDEQAAGRGLSNMQSLTEAVGGPPSSAGNMSMSIDPAVTYQPTGHRVVSSVSSIDWKTWLSANVARLEPSPSPPRRSDVEVAVPSMPRSFGRGHVREGAQIHGEDDLELSDLAILTTHKPTLPFSRLTSAESNSADNTPFQKSVFMTAPPSLGVLREIDNQHSLSELQQSFDRDPLPSPELPPPIPTRSPLRKAPYPVLTSAKSMRDLRDGDESHLQTADENRSPTRMRSTNPCREMNSKLGSPQTPTPNPTRLKKKRSGFLYTPSIALKSEATSPGLTAAMEKQFGPASKTTAANGENKENEGSGDGMRESSLLGSLGPGPKEKSAKSKRSLNVFLSSRRKRMASSSTDNPAFL